ncbi:MAG: GTPase HflX [Angelakisella sp.]
MMSMYENADGVLRETAVLAAVDTGEYDTDISLAELRELADTAEIDILGVVTQKRSNPDPATALGMGRVEELAELVRMTEAEMIIFDMELSPAQLRNIEKVCDCPVLDRTMLILNIFARRAVTSEGKLQVERAQLRYQLPRLAGKGVQLSRQGGGGAGGGGARRGAGESQLETDRRHLRSRIDALSEQLEEVATRRERLRQRRKKDQVTTVAIVGYTNVGKSTLLNTLTQAGVLAEDKLFATLDPTSRALTLPDGRQVMLIDTVGLVRRLPHHLVEAFKSTLEEAANADLILNVCDITSDEMQEQLAVTMELLRSLGAEATPVVTVLNKCDRMAGIETPLGINAVLISAKTGEGLDRLLGAVQEALPDTHLRVKLLLPYSAGDLEVRLSVNGKVFSREYTETGVELDINLDKNLLYLAEQYII